jgi:hypothetical protein
VKPSEVSLYGAPYPLPDLFGRVEREIAVAWVVRALAIQGDVWRVITQPDMGAALKGDLYGDREPWASLRRLGSLGLPDFGNAVKAGVLWSPRLGGVAAFEVPPDTLAAIRMRRRGSQECPKCGTHSACLLWTREQGDWLFALGESEYADAIYECPVHGEFGRTDTGTTFDTAEMYTLSTTGERVTFR